MADLSGEDFTISERDTQYANSQYGHYLSTEVIQMSGSTTDAEGNVTAVSLTLHSNGNGNFNPPINAVRTGFGDSSSETYTVTVTKN